MSAGSSKVYSGRLIQDGFRKGPFNMAADHYLADFARLTSEPALRIYTWEKPTLSLGFHQRFSDGQLDRCRKQGIPVVRRPTGGRAVLHHRELTYCICIPSAHPLIGGGRDELLRSIGLIFVTAASQIGLSAELVRAGNRSDKKTGSLRKGSPLCFDSVSRWEVRLDGRKWIGSAQRFLPGVLLQHGSILLGKSNVDTAALFNLSVISPDGNLNSLYGEFLSPRQIISAKALRAAIPEAFSEYCNLSWREKPFTPSEIEAISSSASNHIISPRLENSTCFNSERSDYKPMTIAQQ